MPNTINWQTKAIKQMKRLPVESGKAIRLAVDTELSDLSVARNVKRLVNHDHEYRLRVGNYRVFFEFDGAIRIVTIEEVRKHYDQTY